MPKRTNEFQQLIYSIQHQLASGAAVTESKFLDDVRTKAPTEVDIVVEITLGEIPVVIGVECTAESRPATVEWVREMIGKHSGLKVDKTVLVAKSGFTKEAINKAQAHGVEAITLVEAENTDWMTLIEQLRDLKLARFTFNAVRQTITFKAIGDPEHPLSVGPLSLIHEPGKETSHSLKDYVVGIARYGPLAEEVMRRWIKTPKEERKRDYEINVTWKCPEGTVLQSDDGIYRPILDIEIKIGISVDDTPLELKSGQFVTTQVAYGTAHNIFDESESSRKVLVTLFENDGKLGAGTLLIPGCGKEDGCIYSMKLPEGDII
jgi:hypothetical protein